MSCQLARCGQRTHRSLLLVVFAFGVLLALPAPWAFAGGPLSIEERVSAQEAIERVFYAHRIWPKENPGQKPSFEAAVSKGSIEANVVDYLRKCVALERVWRQPITAAQLQAEMDRMAYQSKDPAMLKDLFGALGDDPRIIAECLARPALADRLLTGRFGRDPQIHEDARMRAEECLSGLSPRAVATRDPTPGFARRVFLLEGGAPDSQDDEAVDVSREELDRLLSTTPETGCYSTVEETDGAFVIRHPISRRQDRLELEIAAFPKQGLDQWLHEQNFDISAGSDAPGNYHLPEVSPRVTCSEGWTNQSLDDIPDPRYGHTAVWTGTEMIVWGGYSNSPVYNTGGRYNPATETWAPLATEGCPSARMGHTAIWTGTVMVVWGGSSSIGVAALNTGGRYNPVSDTWQSTSVGTNCPSARTAHAAAWGATSMIVWGGWDGTSYFNTGGRYDPVNDAWQSTSTSGSCPLARRGPTAIWTGTYLVAWGGYDGTNKVNTGGRYNPVTNVWSGVSTTSCPVARDGHTAVWTGTAMVIWGGYGTGYLNSGGRYDPGANTWQATSTGTNCPAARNLHTAVWATGVTQMIVWGGMSASGTAYDGARYDPAGDTWAITANYLAPLQRRNHTAVWTGTEMIIWGGEAGATPRPANTGGRYNPSGDSWIDTNRTYAMPTPRTGHTGVWTGTELIIWGGYDGGYVNTGGRYTPTTDTWSSTSTGTNCPDARSGHSAVWSGNEMIVWGGADLIGKKTTGGRYYPTSNTWLTMSGVGPGARDRQTAVWTGVYMIIWGGEFQHGTYLNSGSRYNPATDIWAATSTGTYCPSARMGHTAVARGSHMIVWGGGAGTYTNTGGIYYPITDTWTATSVGTGCPTARNAHTAVWSGSKMVVWGGYDTANTNTGALYDPTLDTWAPTSTGTNCPAGTQGHGAVWAGSEMVVWGGMQTNVGGRYDPVGNSWQPTLAGNGCPFGRDGFTMLWTGGEVILWGGSASAYFNSGGMYRTGHITPPVISGDTEGCAHVAETLQSDTHATYQWALNGLDISGATARTYQASVSGDYTVRGADAHGCEGTSASFSLALIFCATTEVSPIGWPHPLRLVKTSASPTGYYLYFEKIAGTSMIYNIYEGSAGNWYSHGNASGNLCNATVTDLGTGEMRAAITPSSGAHYYLVTAASTPDEGPSGFNSLGVQIPTSQSTCSP